MEDYWRESELTAEQEATVVYWSLLDKEKYRSYRHWLSFGLLPKYAYEKVSEL